MKTKYLTITRCIRKARDLANCTNTPFNIYADKQSYEIAQVNAPVPEGKHRFITVHPCPESPEIN